MSQFIENNETTAYVARMLFPEAKFGKKAVKVDGVEVTLLTVEVVLNSGRIVREDWWPNRQPGNVEINLDKDSPIIQWGVYSNHETGETVVGKHPKWVGMYVDKQLKFFDGFKPEFGEGWAEKE